MSRVSLYFFVILVLLLVDISTNNKNYLFVKHLYANENTEMQNAIPCPSVNFIEFIENYSEKIESQKSFTRYPLQHREIMLDHAPEPIWNTKRESVEQVVFPIIPDKSKRNAEKSKLNYDKIETNFAQVTYVIDDGESINRGGKTFHITGWNSQTRYFFRKDAFCWYLTEIDDLRIPPQNEGQHLVVPNANRAKSCLDQGKRLEQKVTNNHEGEAAKNSAQYFDRALYAYICAARSGSSEGALLAARLGNSQQSRTLSKDYSKQLLLQASNELAEAATSLGLFYCDVDSEESCENPDKGVEFFLKGEKMGDAIAYNFLGVGYERGTFGKIDIPRALACYQQGANKDELAKYNFDRLSKKYPNTAATECYQSK